MMKHYARSSWRKAACGKRVTDVTRAHAGAVITCEACRVATGKRVMPRFDRQGNELPATTAAAIAAQDEVQPLADSDETGYERMVTLDNVSYDLTDEQLAALAEFDDDVSAGKLTRAEAVRAVLTVHGIITNPCPHCGAGVPFSASGNYHQTDPADEFALVECVNGGRERLRKAEGQVARDLENAMRGDSEAKSGTPRETATPVQRLKTTAPDFTVRNQTVLMFAEPCTESWSSLLRRVAAYLDEHPDVEDNVTDLGGFIKYDMHADDIVHDGHEHVEHVIEVLVSPTGITAKLPRNDQRPRIVSVDLPFDSAHDLVAFGDCDCKLDDGVLNKPCIVCVTRARLFQITGDAMYADDRNDSNPEK